MNADNVLDYEAWIGLKKVESHLWMHYDLCIFRAKNWLLLLLCTDYAKSKFLVLCNGS